MSLEDFARYIDAIAPEAGTPDQSYVDDGPSTGTTAGSDHVASTRRRPALIGIAALVAMVVLVAGFAVLSAQHDEDSAPVVAGPVPEGTWTGPALLAPRGLDWFVTRWAPQSTDFYGSTADQYQLEFEYQGFTWTLEASDADHIGHQGELGIEQAGSRYVRTSGTMNDDGSVGVPAVMWYELDGTRVTLSGKQTGSPTRPVSPSKELILEAVELIEELPTSAWTPALTPPDGAPDPDTGVTARPLRLGLAASEADTSLTLAPWVAAWSDIRPAGTGDRLELQVRTVEATDPTGATIGTDADLEGSDVTIRGTEATLVRVPFGEDGPAMLHRYLEDDAATSGLVWEESGSRVALYYPARVSDDEAMALAESLIVLDDQQWSALLYPTTVIDPTTPNPDPGGTDATAEMCSVFTAATDIPAGLPVRGILADGMVREEQIPAPFVPSTALTDLSQISGSALFEIKADSVLIDAMFEPSEAASSDPAAEACNPPDSMTTPTPSDTTTTDQAWRLLGDELVGDPYRTGVATNPEQYADLWATAGMTSAAPEVDFESEIVVWLGTGYGSGCPITLDEIVIADTPARIHGVYGPDEERTCLRDLNPRSFVVAIDRSALPTGPFVVQIFPGDPPPPGPAQRTLVDADLAAPGAVATDDQITSASSASGG